MATYTGAELSGDGVDNPTLTAGVEYTFVMVIPTNLSGSGYFVMEQITNSTGSYTDWWNDTGSFPPYSGSTSGSDGTNGSGSYVSMSNIPEGGLITSSYGSAIVCKRNPPDAVSYKFIPAANVLAGTSKMRSTGGIGLELTP